jgi:hypothetical protein
MDAVPTPRETVTRFKPVGRVGSNEEVSEMQHTKRATTRVQATAVPADGRSIEVWTRHTPDEAHREHPCVDRIRRLERDGYADRVVVREWDRTVFLDEPVAPRKRLARRRVADFREWARVTTARLPEFDREATVGTGRMGPEHEAQYLPPIVVAVYEDGVLTNVVPHVRDDHTVTVTEWLRRVESDGRASEPVVVC